MTVLDARDYILSRLPGTKFNSSGQIHTRCPFHDDNSPSFSIREDGVFVCGSPKCGIRGSFAYFYKLMEKIESWAQVYRDLRMNQVTPDLEVLFAEKKRDTKKYWVSPFPQPPMVEPIRSIKYLLDRGLGLEIVARFGLLYGVGGDCAGISITDAIVAPVYDLNGSYITFQVRYLSPSAPRRWQMPSGSAAQNVLYGGWLIDGTAVSKDLWIVEGASDVWNMVRLGVHSVGLFTNKASAAQLNRIRDLCSKYDLRPIVCMDGDACFVGKEGRAVDMGAKVAAELSAYGLNVRTAYLRKEEDPGNLTEVRLREVYSEMADASAF